MMQYVFDALSFLVCNRPILPTPTCHCLQVEMLEQTRVERDQAIQTKEGLLARERMLEDTMIKSTQTAAKDKEDAIRAAQAQAEAMAQRLLNEVATLESQQSEMKASVAKALRAKSFADTQVKRTNQHFTIDDDNSRRLADQLRAKCSAAQRSAILSQTRAEHLEAELARTKAQMLSIEKERQCMVDDAKRQVQSVSATLAITEQRCEQLTAEIEQSRSAAAIQESALEVLPQRHAIMLVSQQNETNRLRRQRDAQVAAVDAERRRSVEKAQTLLATQQRAAKATETELLARIAVRDASLADRAKEIHSLRAENAKLRIQCTESAANLTDIKNCLAVAERENRSLTEENQDIKLRVEAADKHVDELIKKHQELLAAAAILRSERDAKELEKGKIERQRDRIVSTLKDANHLNS